MIDDAELALAMVAHPDGFEAALDEFEPKMSGSSEESVRLTRDNPDVAFAEGGLKAILDQFDHRER